MATNKVIVTPVRTPSISLSTPDMPSVIVKPFAGGGGGGIKFSVEDGHILAITGPISVENNDTIVL